jgi:hypothetical protein
MSTNSASDNLYLNWTDSGRTRRLFQAQHAAVPNFNNRANRLSLGQLSESGEIGTNVRSGDQAL